MKKINILHLSLDDKFTDVAIEYFEKVTPNSNFLIVYDNKEKLKFIKTSCEVIKKRKFIKKIILVKQFDCVVVHALSNVWFDLILSLPKNIPIIWLGWGYDYYDLIPGDTFLYETKKMFELKNQGHKALILNFKSKIRSLVMPSKIKVIERINFFSPVLESEYNIIKINISSSIFPEYISFHYGSLENNIVIDNMDTIIEGNNILLGNSATYTNNHLEALELLKNIGLKNGGKIICPLSYGDVPYRQSIIKKGNNIFGCEFHPIVDFIPVDQYLDIIKNCRFVIMNHIRQQALGNINSMLFFGAKVFLREENPIFKFFKDLGVFIFSIQDLQNNHSLLDNGLSIEEIKKNRQILTSLWSDEVTLNKTRKLIFTILGC